MCHNCFNADSVNMALENYLKNIYYNPSKPASFSGPDKLYQFVKKDGKYMISKYRIRKWLQREEAYSLQREARKPPKRSRIVVAGIDDQWSADLMDMVKFAKSNQGVRFILVVIDVFSKHLWLQPLKDKKGPSIVEAFRTIFNKGRKPKRIRTDKGQEFRAKVVQSLFKSESIRHMFAESDVKASVSERVIKTIKSKIYRYFTQRLSYEYVNELQSFAEGYNKTVHRTIDMRPIDVRRDNEEEARLATYLSRQKTERPINTLIFKFKVGDYVRISHTRNIFTRAYDESWTGEIFKVAQRFVRDGVPLYRLTDYNGTEEIKGSFYTSELSKTQPPETFKVEKILKTRGKGNNKQYYVKFLHYPKQLNQWILANDIQNV